MCIFLLPLTFTSSRLRSTFSVSSWFACPPWLSDLVLKERDSLEVSLGERGLRGERGPELCMRQGDWIKRENGRDGEMLSSTGSQLHLTHSPSPRKKIKTPTHTTGLVGIVMSSLYLHCYAFIGLKILRVAISRGDQQTCSFLCSNSDRILHAWQKRDILTCVLS